MNTARSLTSPMRWCHICDVGDICPESGVAALIGGQQVAVFRVRDGIYAIGNHDPASGTNVLSRGIVGDLDGELVVASPMYKQHFSLITGRCLEDPDLQVPVYAARLTDEQVWVRAEPAPASRVAGRRRLVIIGNGPAAMRTLEELMELAPRAFEIVVFGGEPHDTYNRVLLSAVLAGEKPVEQIITHPSTWFREHGIVLHNADPVVQIDRARRRVRSHRGIEIGYDRLLIATGSMPVLLQIPGADLPGVMSFRDLQDVQTMLSAARAHRRAVVIGGGLLGLEAAIGLLRQGMQVTVVQLGETLMNLQLDAAAATLLRAELEARGLEFYMPAATAAILGNGAVTGVRLEDGRELPADLVVIAIGVRPHIELARNAGLRCERGILVDDTLLTFDPSIYAVGECVQHRGSTYGVVAPLCEQARVCAAHLAERGVRRYRGSSVSTQLKIDGIEVFSAGDAAGSACSETLVFRDPGRRVYKRLVLENDRVRGAVLYGDIRDGHWYSDLINEGHPVGRLRDQLMFSAAAAVQ